MKFAYYLKYLSNKIIIIHGIVINILKILSLIICLTFHFCVISYDKLWYKFKYFISTINVTSLTWSDIIKLEFKSQPL